MIRFSLVLIFAVSMLVTFMPAVEDMTELVSDRVTMLDNIQ